ncbi:MAG TPA: PocR ligand-binding domain-containing protein [Prolixibacteraceae bacterium]|nr:PocR ligand-binding domain-containing protein [Prolixibacteraceae bacterium]
MKSAAGICSAVELEKIENTIEYSDIFSVAELQQQQDLFSNATGVASLITKPDGTPITQPTNFCRFCMEVIRKNENGLKNCVRSDVELGKICPDGPIMQPCLSGGLWDAGVSIVVGGKHLASWFIGQVRNEDLDEERIEAYADQIGVDRELYRSAFLEVPVMSTAKFRSIVDLLSLFANQLSERAYRNKELEFRINEHQKVEEKLRLSEEKYRLLVEHQNDLVVKVGADNKFMYVSPSYCKVFGKKESELLGNSFLPLVHPDDVEPTKESMKKLSQSPYTCKVVQRAMTVNGWRWFSWSDKAIVNEKGEIESVIGVGRDISGRMEAEKQLEASEKKFRNLIENSMVGVIQGEEDWSCKFANHAALQMFEAESIEELNFFVGKSLFKDPQEKDRLLKLLKEKDRIENYELEVITCKGNEKFILVSMSISNHQIDGTLIDITERKLAEKEVHRKNEELYASNVEKDKFFSIIAHDLRSPFNSFLGLSHIMAEDLDNMTLDQIQKIAVSMKESAGNVNRLLENLLNWSRSRRGLIPFKPQHYSVKKLFEDCSESCFSSASIKSIVLDFDLQENLFVYADALMLQTIMRNLVSNSLKFTNPGGRVVVSAKKDPNNQVIFTVKDTGIGMNKAIMDGLFKMDINTSRKGTEGEPSTGLGLLLCKEFIDQHNGHIWVESIEGKGSCFFVSIPDKIREKKE